MSDTIAYRGHEIATDCCPPHGCGLAQWHFRRIGADSSDGVASTLAGAKLLIDDRVTEEKAMDTTHTYTIRIEPKDGPRAKWPGITTEDLARRLAAERYAAGDALYVAVEYRGTVIAEHGNRPAGDDAIGRDFDRRQRRLDTARARLAQATDDATIRRLTAEVERLSYME